MAAIETMKIELEKILNAQTECVSESGYIKDEHKCRYQLLVRKAKSFKESINWMKKLYGN